MSLFTKHDESTAPADAAAVLSAAKARYGFVPNLAAYVAESPVVLGAILKLSEQFEATSLTSQEQQVVLLTVSALNGCAYCRTVHTALGRMAHVEGDTLEAIVAFEPLADARIAALREFTRAIIEERGWLEEKTVLAFLDAGFTRAQVFEVVLGVALKTVTNYSNHLAGAEPNEEFIAMASAPITA